MAIAKTRFRPRLVGGPEGDPALFLDIEGARRALLLDCGDLSPLPPDCLQRVSHCLVSHAHLDHFYGFDRLLRVNIARVRTIRVAGPEGILEHVGGKLAGYHWNLYEELGLEFVVTEVRADRFRVQTFRVRDRFRPAGEPIEEPARDELLRDEDVTVRWAILDHGIPCLAFSVVEPDFLNVDERSLAELGLAPGAWLRRVKDAVAAGEDERSSIETPAGPRPLGELARELLRKTPGAKICYATDTAYTPATRDAIASLAAGADLLFCEHYYLDEDRELAARNCHLTARQAGELARAAGAKDLVPFHHSPKYSGDYGRLVEEGRRAFRGELEEPAR
ncbi:MAG: ribonuclease Z [Planctomycetes bacterium]|nr:ribonuclease Z [Planctomycetota bacterium]